MLYTDDDPAILTKKEWFKVDEFFREKVNGPLWKIGLYNEKDDSLDGAGENALQAIIKLLPNIKKSTRVLCLGAHSVNIAQYLVEEFGCKVDISVHPDIEEKYRDLVQEEPFDKKINMVKAESTSLPYSWDTFDLAISFDFVGSHERQSKIIQEVSYVLKPKGRFLFSTLFLDEKIDKPTAGVNDHLKSMDDYRRIANRTELQRVIKREMTDQLVVHYAQLKTLITDNASAANKQVGKTTAKKLINWYGESGDALENGDSTWGILVFQKQNA